MLSLVGVLKLVAEIVLQPVSFLLLFLGSRPKNERKHSRVRIFGWWGCALYAFLDALLLMSVFNYEHFLAHAVALILALIMLRCELRTGYDPEGHSHLYVARVVGATGLLNFAISYITVVNGVVTYLVALQSLPLGFLLGVEISFPYLDTMGNPLWFKTQYFPDPVLDIFPQIRVPVPPTDVAVVYECTGLREILFVFFAIAFVSAVREKKRKAFFISAPLIYGANILRNNLVIGLYGGGLSTFAFAHSILGNIVVFLAMTAAAVTVFLIIPEIYEHLSRIAKQLRRK